MKLSELKKFGNEDILLRKLNDSKVEEYAEKMQAGVKFPPVIVGTWPNSDKYGSQGLVDGLHRVAAALKAGIVDLDTETKTFPTLQAALSFMYTANMAHGQPVTEGQRNARILLLKKIDPALTLEKIGETFKLGKSTIDRILKGQTQGAEKSGLKTGTKKSAAHKNLEPMKPTAFFTALKKLEYTCARKRPLTEILAFASPISEDHPDGEVDEDKLALMKSVKDYLGAMISELK
jgi:hypothetical protein